MTPTTQMSSATCDAIDVAKVGAQQDATHHVIALPHSLLEFVLVRCTSAEDKKPLRQACKLFRQILDSSLTCIKLAHCGKRNLRHVKCFLERMRHVRCLRAVTITENCSSSGRLLVCLPSHITLLRIDGGYTNLKDLQRLSNLTSLILPAVERKAPGLEHLQGLTRLQCYSPSCSLAHLAPTLKHLSISRCEGVPDMMQLTNLEVLELRETLPKDFFQTHSQCRLKHIRFNASYATRHTSHSIVWKSAPTTLARLTVAGAWNITPSELPTSITHLQVLGAPIDIIKDVAAALPWLRRLDLRLYGDLRCWRSDFANIGQLTNLQSLSLCVTKYYVVYEADEYLRQSDILSELPGLAMAVGQGLSLNVIQEREELMNVFEYPCHDRSTWVGAEAVK